MKKVVVFAISIVCLLMACADGNDTTSNTKTIAPEYRGKWELVSLRLVGESPNTTHTLPYSLNGVLIKSGGYEVGETYAKSYGNGVILNNMQGIYSEGNSFYDSSGKSGVKAELSNNGNNCTLTTVQEIDYCKKVSKFSWE
jgi:hypothetical protein